MYFHFARRQLVVLFPTTSFLQKLPQLEPCRGHTLTSQTGSLVALRWGEEGGRGGGQEASLRSRVPTRRPFTSKLWRTHTPTPPSPISCFYHLLPGGDINPLAGCRSLRVHPKAVCPPPPPASSRSPACGQVCDGNGAKAGGREGGRVLGQERHSAGLLLLCRSRENHLLQDRLCPEVTARKSVQPTHEGLLIKANQFVSVFECLSAWTQVEQP